MLPLFHVAPRPIRMHPKVIAPAKSTDRFSFGYRGNHTRIGICSSRTVRHVFPRSLQLMHPGVPYHVTWCSILMLHDVAWCGVMMRDVHDVSCVTNSYVQPQRTIQDNTSSNERSFFQVSTLWAGSPSYQRFGDRHGTRSLYSKTLCLTLQSLALGQLVEGPRQERKQITLHTATWSSISSNYMCSMFVRTFALHLKQSWHTGFASDIAKKQSFGCYTKLLLSFSHWNDPRPAGAHCAKVPHLRKIGTPRRRSEGRFPTSGSLHTSGRILFVKLLCNLLADVKTRHI